MKRPRSGLWTEMMVLFYAVRRRDVPFWPKLVAGGSILYLLSPIDLIPDFIPFAGWVDDLIVVPLLLHLSYRLLPPVAVQESRARALVHRRRLKRTGWIALFLLLALMAWIFWYWHSRG